jgi:hypothetical protein
MQDAAGAQADALGGGTLRARWLAAVLAQPEGAPAAAAARAEVNHLPEEKNQKGCSIVAITVIVTAILIIVIMWIA